MGNAFKAVLAGGSGNKVIVTCAPQFAGATITCTNNTKTYTKVCPSTSPYTVEFKGLDVGTWTISGTIQGTVFTTTVEVQDVSAVLSYGFAWTTWVDTASQLDSTDYDTLDELLEDEKAVRELMLEHACVDYLSSFSNVTPNLEKVIENDICAKWINLSDYALDTCYANATLKAVMDEVDKYFYGEWALVGQVPKMTSNTAPYGQAIASTEQYPAWRAFSQSDDMWYPTTSDTAANCYIGYKFDTPVSIKEIGKFYMHNNTGTAITYKVQASNTGNADDWIDASEVYSHTGSGYISEKPQITIDGSYSYWRLKMVSGTTYRANYGGFCIKFLQFYAWAPKGNVPVMTANTAPYGTANASSNYTGQEPYKAFDGNDSTSWVPNVGQGVNAILYWHPTNPTCAKRIKYRSDNGRPTSIEIQGYNDEGAYTRLGLFSPSGTGIQYFDLDNNNYYLHYCLIIRATSEDLPHVNILQFYGRELTDLVPPMISNTLPSGEASANHETYPAYYSFNKNFSTSNGWYTYEHTVTDEWLKYKFDNQVDAKFIKLTLTAASNTSHAYKSIFQGSNDDNIWKDITDELSYTIAGTSTVYTYFQSLITNNPYQYYRLKFTYSDATGADAITPWIIEIQIYGKDYSEKEFEEGTTKKWLYDHGVELVEFEKLTTGNGWTPPTNTQFSENAHKTPNSLYVGPSETNKADGFGLKTAIDFTPYSLFRFINDGLSGNEDIAYYFKTSKSLVSPVAYIYSSNNKGSGLDVSSLNENEYFSISSINSTARKGEVYELWLE